MMGAPHIAEGPRYCIVEAGAILSDAGFGNRLEDPPRGAGEVDDFVHPAMKLQVEDFISRANGTRQLSWCFFGVIEFSGRIHAAANIQQDRSEEHTSELQSPCN